MKKILLFMMAWVVSFGVKAQELDQNVGLGQLSYYSPASGVINLDINESGLMSLCLRLNGEGDVNRKENLYCHLLRDGEVISNVQTCNYRQVYYDKVMNDEWQISFFLKRNPEVKRAGNYKVVFDPGFFIINGQPSTKIEINYCIPAEECEFFPAPGQVKSLNEITLTFAGARELRLAENFKVEIYNIYGGKPDEPGDLDDDEEENSGNTDDEYVIIPAYSVNGNVITLKPAEPITQYGTWYVSIDENLITLIMDDGSEKESAGVLGIYTIPNVKEENLPRINPEPGETDGFPGTIYVTLPKDETIILVNPAAYSYIYPVEPDGTLGRAIAKYVPKKSVDYENTIELIYIDGAVKMPDTWITPAPGDYVLVVGNSTYWGKLPDGTQIWRSEMRFNYNVYVFDEVPTTIEPADGSTNAMIKEISFRFDEAETVELRSNSELSLLQSSTTNYIFTPYIDPEDNLKVIFTTPLGATIDGEYTFTSAPGQLFVDDNNLVVTATFRISKGSGIECKDLEMMPAEVDVYSMQGILLKKKADINYLHCLPTGIYIAGGKKYVVK